jgi:hypothetical protein
MATFCQGKMRKRMNADMLQTVATMIEANILLATIYRRTTASDNLVTRTPFIWMDCLKSRPEAVLFSNAPGAFPGEKSKTWYVNCGNISTDWTTSALKSPLSPATTDNATYWFVEPGLRIQ